MVWLLFAKERVAGWGTAITRAPQEWRAWMDALASSLMSGDGVRAITYCLILLLIGGSVEWLFWTYAHGPLRTTSL